jgi:hypothetical protein
MAAALVRHGVAALATLVLAPVAGAALLAKPAWRADFGERLGLRGPHAAGAVWVHGASVGEILAATRLLDALRQHGARWWRPPARQPAAPSSHARGPMCRAATRRSTIRGAPKRRWRALRRQRSCWSRRSSGRAGSQPQRDVTCRWRSSRDASRSAACRATRRWRRCCAALQPARGGCSQRSRRGRARSASRRRIAVTGDLKLEAPGAGRARTGSRAALAGAPFWVAAARGQAKPCSAPTRRRSAAGLAKRWCWRRVISNASRKWGAARRARSSLAPPQRRNGAARGG